MVFSLTLTYCTDRVQCPVQCCCVTKKEDGSMLGVEFDSLVEVSEKRAHLEIQKGTKATPLTSYMGKTNGLIQP